MIYLLKDNIKFSKIREEKIIPIISLTNTRKIHIQNVNIGDLIFDIQGSIGSIIEIISEKECKAITLMVASFDDTTNHNIISSYR